MRKDIYSPWRPLGDPRLLLICGVLLVAVAVTGFLSYAGVRESTQDAAIAQLAGEARLTGVHVRNTFLRMERDAVIVSQTPPIQGIIRSRAAGGIDPLDGSSYQRWRTRLETIFASVIRRRSEYTQIRYIGFADDGREIVRVNSTGDEVERVPEAELQEKGNEPYMQIATGLTPGESRFSEITLNRENGKVEEPAEPVIRVLIPVFDEESGLPFGVIVINAHYERLLFNALNDARPSHTTYLVNRAGDYLNYEPNGGAGDLEFHLNYKADIPTAVQHALRMSGEEEHFIEDGKVDFATRVDVLGDDHTQLLVVMEVPQETLLAPARRIRTQTLALAVTLLAAVAAFAWLLIRHYTAPLTEMTNTVLRGDGAHALPVDRDDELGALARAFVSLTEDLERTELKAKAVLDTVNDGIITIDRFGTIATVNPACQVIFGYTPEECIGQNIKMLMPPHYARHHDDYLKTYAKTGEKHIIGFGREVEGLRKDGSVFALDLSVSELTLGDKPMFTGIVRDISQRKEAEKNMEAQREFLDLVMNTNPNMIYVLDADMRIVQANRVFREAFPVDTRDQVFGSLVRTVLSEADTQKSESAKLEAFEHGYSEVNSTVIFPDGKVRSIVAQNVRFENAEGETFVLCIARDMTELEKLTGMLAQSNKELDDFAYVASHDLKAPLRVIDNASTWLMEDLEDKLDEDSRENLTLIRSRVLRMERLLDDLLEYSRIGRKLAVDKEEIVSGSQLLDDVVHLLTPGEDRNIIVGRDFADIRLPKMPLQQIFLNLIGNAIKHAESGKELRVEVGVEEMEGTYRFSVKDNGPGIPAEYHQQIFQMFQTLKPRDVVEGSGMGLAIVRKHIEQHGGRIWLDSREGEGTTFYFTWKK
ncbi:PAS domain S-box protein [Rhizobium sp. L1K21]|uniref:PAS domain S-box protein n=1 Tax=Rhizobium sp. L1K21 TaxID=2954933 RepID=UPI002092CC36|nr:PAS domain S-box protein [Rhizobium sp. L1K21]MCO6188302.1 PAS domain S-box protein [Rhizobium sp. L1K21]